MLPVAANAANAGGTPTCGTDNPDLSINEVNSHSDWSEVFVRHYNVGVSGWALGISKNNATPTYRYLGNGTGCVNSSGAGCTVDSTSAQYNVPTWINFAGFSIDKNGNNQVALFSPDGNVVDMVTFTTNSGSCSYSSTHWGNPGACNKCVTGVGSQVKDYYAIPDGTTTWTDSSNGNSEGQADGSQGDSNVAAVAGCTLANSYCFHTYALGTVDTSGYCPNRQITIPVSLVYADKSGAPTTTTYEIPEWNPVPLSYQADIAVTSGSISPETATATWTGSTSADTTAGVQGVTLSGIQPDASGSLTLALTDPALGAVLRTATVALPECFHHLEIDDSTVGSGLTCTPSTLTVRACADGATPCTPYTGGVSGTLSFTPASSATVIWEAGSGAFAIGSGSSSVTKTMQVTSASTGSLDIVTPAPVPPSATTCTFPSPGNDCGYMAADAGFLFDVPDHVSESSQTFSVSAVRKSDSSLVCVPAFASISKSVNFTCTYENPTGGSQAVRIGGSALNVSNSPAVACDATGRALNLTFDGNGVASASLAYADVGRLNLAASYIGSGSDAGLQMTGSDFFIAAPASFAFSAISAGPLKAGAEFTAKVTARNAAGNTTPNFGQETTAETVSIAATRFQPSAGVDGTFTTESVGAFAAGSATATMRYGEVGSVDLAAVLASGSYLGSALTASGSTGGAGAVGRFVPDHFDTIVTPDCAGFAYSGQPFSVTMTAMNGLATPTRTENYRGDQDCTGSPSGKCAQAVALSEENGVDGDLDNPAVAASEFAGGEATVATPTFTFTNRLTSPSDIKLRAVDDDGASSETGSEGTVNLRSGRVRLSSAFGSAALPLDMPAEVQVWSGNFWARHAADNGCAASALPAATPLVGVAQGGAAPYQTSNGSYALTFSASAGVAVSGDVTWGAGFPEWLKYPWGGAAAAAPTARISFGLYKGSNRFIYRREVR